MNIIKYISGDATAPVTSGRAIIVHICNDVGGWGAGFVLAISKRWPEPEKQYRAWHQSPTAENPPFELGRVQFVDVGDGITIANLIGQQGLRRQGKKPPVRYDSIEIGLSKIAERATQIQASIHMPRIGCGLAGGQWSEIEPLIERQLLSQNLSVTVYDFSPP